MSIPVLTQVYDEVRRLAIAGSAVAPGDFRLKKLVPPLEQAGQKAPVFAKVAQAVNSVVDSNEQTAAAAILELSTLVNAILYTQGVTGVEGELTPLETTDLGQQETQTSARILKPLLEALTSTGSGRLEIIRDAHARGVFRDLRLIRPALAALDDTYPDIADFVCEHVLPPYGQAILPDLRARFNSKGKTGDMRRLGLMHRLDPVGTREIAKQVLEEGSKEVKVVAIECLGDAPEDLVFLLEQSKAKAKDVREAALKALARSGASDAVEALRKALTGSDIELAVTPVRDSRDERLLKIVLDEAAKQRDALFASKSLDKETVSKLSHRLLWLLECLRGRDDAASETFLLNLFALREKLGALKGEPGGKDLRHKLVSVMCVGTNKTRIALVDAHESLTEDELGGAFAAARTVCTTEQIFDLFSPYLIAGATAKRRGSVVEKSEVIRDALIGRSRWGVFDSLVREPLRFVAELPLDARWLDLAISVESGELVMALTEPEHEAGNEFLSRIFKTTLTKSAQYHEEYVLSAMVRVKHPEAADALIATIKKHVGRGHLYALHWIYKLIPDLPGDDLPKFEALLPTLPEKALNELLEFVTQLKLKTTRDEAR
jgi:hypothetical protein